MGFMQKVAISVFRANVPRWLEEVKKGRTLILTSHGRAVARLAPPVSEREAAQSRLKALRKTAYIGDILSPVGEVWESD